MLAHHPAWAAMEQQIFLVRDIISMTVGLIRDILISSMKHREIVDLIIRIMLSTLKTDGCRVWMQTGWIFPVLSADLDGKHDLWITTA